VLALRTALGSVAAKERDERRVVLSERDDDEGARLRFITITITTMMMVDDTDANNSKNKAPSPGANNSTVVSVLAGTAAAVPYKWNDTFVPATEILQLWTEVGNGIDKSQTGTFDCCFSDYSVVILLMEQ
jgi:hypothetical protein